VKQLTLFPLVVVALVLFACPLARAQTQPAASDDAENPFAAGTNTFSLTSSYVTPIRFSEARIYNVNLERGWYVWDNTSFNLELQGYWADQPQGNTDAVIGGIGILGRTHLYRSGKFSLFIDGGGSVTYAETAFPTTPYAGTHFNLTGKVGLGATYELKDHLFLAGGARYFHLSNAQIHNKDQNPSYDGIQIWAGLMWTW
jgi:hypothetical protein